MRRIDDDDDDDVYSLTQKTSMHIHRRRTLFYLNFIVPFILVIFLFRRSVSRCHSFHILVWCYCHKYIFFFKENLHFILETKWRKNKNKCWKQTHATIFLNSVWLYGMSPKRVFELLLSRRWNEWNHSLRPKRDCLVKHY